MAFVGLKATSTTLASLPIACPRCGRETVHIYGLEGKAPRLLSWTLPIGPSRAFARCAMCGTSRRVPFRDRKKIQRAIHYNPRTAFSAHASGYVETTLGRVDTNPSRIRRYPTQIGPQRAALVLALLVLMSCPGIVYRAVQVMAEMQGDRWVERGMERYDAGRFQASLLWYRRAGWMFRIAGSEIKEAECAYLIGRSHYELEEYWDALLAYEASLPVWEATNDREMQADCLMYIGYLRIYMSDLHGALEALDRSRELWLEADEWRLQAEAFRGLGIAYEGLEQYNKAIQAYSQAVALFEKLNDREEAAELQVWIDQLRRLLPNYGTEEKHAWRLSIAA